MNSGNKLLPAGFSCLKNKPFLLMLFGIGASLIAQSTMASESRVDEQLIRRDFMRVVMSAEFGGKTRFGRSVKKYDKTVRFAVINHAKKDRRHAVHSFIWTLPQKIVGLKTSVVANVKRANFRIHVVDQKQYGNVIRNHIYKNKNVRIRGRCFVRVLPGHTGIGETDVVIVSDHGERIFNRCLVEEVLQGLGPLADRGHRDYSVFNTASQHSSFTLHDQVLMNALYDPRIKAGMSKGEVAKVLPHVVRDCIARVEQD